MSLLNWSPFHFGCVDGRLKRVVDFVCATVVETFVFAWNFESQCLRGFLGGASCCFVEWARN